MTDCGGGQQAKRLVTQHISGYFFESSGAIASLPARGAKRIADTRSSPFFQPAAVCIPVSTLPDHVQPHALRQRDDGAGDRGIVRIDLESRTNDWSISTDPAASASR